MMKICLFTAHSPQTGGGAVILRSLVKNLPEFDFQWKYIAREPANGFEEGFLGQGIMGSSLVKDISGTWLMLTGRSVKIIDVIIKELLETECDAYWIVSHNEGLRVAIELSRLQAKRQVHLTIHDDWSGALSARSKRYYLMAGLAKKMTIKALQQVSGFDMICRGMQTYYLQLSERHGDICHRYLPQSSLGALISIQKTDFSEINVGHIGSIYDKDDFIRFLILLKKFGKKKGKKIMVNMWGYHPKKDDIPDFFHDILKIQPDLPEENAIPELMKCDFVYSMYPMAENLSIFCKTSLPTKLSSYVLAGKPIFGHGPVDSSLEEFIQKTGTGVMWTSIKNEDGMELLDEIMKLQPTVIQWQKARDDYFGERNLAVMRSAFQNATLS